MSSETWDAFYPKRQQYIIYKYFRFNTLKKYRKVTLFVIIILFFLINVVYVVFFNQAQSFIQIGIPFFSYLNQIFVLALIFSFLNFMISFLFGNLWSLVRSGSLVNPFTR